MKRATQSRRGLLALALGVAVIAPGCSGLGSDDEVPVRVNGPEVVTRQQIQRMPAGSPQRALFEWWRAIQFDNAIEATPYYARSLNMTADKLDRVLTFGPAALGLTRRPLLEDVETNGDEAVVYVLLEAVARNPNDRLDKTRTARAFNLVREGGEWKLADNRYLARAAQVQRVFAEAARRQTQEPESPTTTP